MKIYSVLSTIHTAFEPCTSLPKYSDTESVMYDRPVWSPANNTAFQTLLVPDQASLGLHTANQKKARGCRGSHSFQSSNDSLPKTHANPESRAKASKQNKSQLVREVES